MARLRYNLLEGTLGADLAAAATSITFLSALQEGGVNIPTIGGGDVIVLRIDQEVLYLTAYTSGATTGTVSRGEEDTVDDDHFAGATVKNVITKDDFSGGGGSSAVSWVSIAASDSTAEDIAAANYVCDGTNDQVEIQDAIDTHGTGGALTIQFAPGTYSIGAQIDVDCSADVEFIGVEYTGRQWGTRPFISKDAAGDFSVFDCPAIGQVAFVGITVDNQNTETISSPLIHIGSSTKLMMRGCTLNAYTGNSSGKVIGADGGVLILWDTLIDSDGYSIRQTSGSIVIELHNCDFYSDATIAMYLAVGSVTIIDSTLDGSAGALKMLDGNAYIRNGYMIGDNADAVYLISMSRFTIDGGRFSASNGSAIRLESSVSGEITGIKLDGVDRHAIWALDCNDILIEGNNLLDYGQQTDATYSGILLDGDTNNCQVINNRLRTQTSGNKALYGIRIDDSTCDNNLVEGNDLLGSSKTNGNEFSDIGTGTRGWLEKKLTFRSGVLTVLAGTERSRFTRSAVLGLSYIDVNTAPTGASLIVDINVGGSTIYSTTGNRPTIAISGFANTPTAFPNTTYIAAAGYMSADVDQIGSSVAGSDLTVVQRYMPI